MEFQANMIQLVTSNFDLAKLKKSKKKKNSEQLEAQAKERWDRLIKFILQLVPPSSIPPEIIELLQKGRFIE